jgi:hypothetical protein
MDISPTRIDDGPNNQPLLGMVQKPPGGQIDVPLRLGGSLLIDLPVIIDVSQLFLVEID